MYDGLILVQGKQRSQSFMFKWDARVSDLKKSFHMLILLSKQMTMQHQSTTFMWWKVSIWIELSSQLKHSSGKTLWLDDKADKVKKMCMKSSSLPLLYCAASYNYSCILAILALCCYVAVIGCSSNGHHCLSLSPRCTQKVHDSFFFFFLGWPGRTSKPVAK